MKFTLARPTRPRNPLVAPSLFRQAGRHADRSSRQRQLGRRDLQRELNDANRSAVAAKRTPPDPHSP
jgi:hypothetical protein